jgi:hypothetical protein
MRNPGNHRPQLRELATLDELERELDVKLSRHRIPVDPWDDEVRGSYGRRSWKGYRRTQYKERA